VIPTRKTINLTLTHQSTALRSNRERKLKLKRKTSLVSWQRSGLRKWEQRFSNWALQHSLFSPLSHLLVCSSYISLFLSFIPCKVLFGVTLQFQAFSCFFSSLVSCFSCAPMTLLLFGMITQCVWPWPLSVFDYNFGLPFK